MNGDDLEGRAAEYVLGTLDAEERERLAQAAEQDPGVRAAIEEWEGRLAGLETDTSSIAPPADLWRRVESRIDGLQPERIKVRTIRAAQGEWVLRSPGVEKKTLFIDHDARTETYLLRLAPGATLPTHSHDRVEECLVVEGDVAHGDLRLTAGDYHVVGPGQVHNDVRSQNGAVLYIRGEIRDAA